MPVGSRFSRSRFLWGLISATAGSVVAVFGLLWGTRREQTVPASKLISFSPKRPVVTVAPEGSVLLDEERVSYEELAEILAERLSAPAEREVHLKIGQNVHHAEVAAVMKLAREAGATRYKLVASK
jgi:biopolymer transport protein ExbD